LQSIHICEAVMAIQILNCASMSPWWPRWHIGGVCLLVDTDQGPVLVDTGLGLHDHEDPSRLVRFFRMDLGILYAPDETAVRQVAARGIQPEAVHHIVLTHLHFDHAGGLRIFLLPGSTCTARNMKPCSILKNGSRDLPMIPRILNTSRIGFSMNMPPKNGSILWPSLCLFHRACFLSPCLGTHPVTAVWQLKMDQDGCLPVQMPYRS
jgi:hypothetical protein